MSATSPFVRSCLLGLGLPAGVLALDLPCGDGRHSVLLIETGATVVAADLDSAMLAITKEHAPLALCTQLDARASLPFRAGTFDLVMVVHPVDLNLLPAAAEIVRPGGHLILETFGAQGMNALSLPLRGEVQSRMSHNFSAIRYVEQATRKAPDRVTVKALFRRVPNDSL